MRAGELSRGDLPTMQVKVKVNKFKVERKSADGSVGVSGEIVCGQKDPLVPGDYHLVVIDHSGERRACQIAVTKVTLAKDKKVGFFRGTLIQP